MAAASIGQVHRAVLPNGKQVAVKVQRPNAPRQVESDIQLLEQAARFIKERVHALDFVDSREVVDEFARSLRQELDYRQEASNARVFHRNFAGHPNVVVPRLYGSYSSQRVLTLEFLEGIQLADLEPTTGRSTSAAPRLRDRRDVADDDLPARLLPRRSASRRTSSSWRPTRSGSSISGSRAS